MDKREAEKSLEEIKKHLRDTEEELRITGVWAVDIQFLWGVLALIGLGLSIFFHDRALYNLIWLNWACILAIGSFFGYRMAKRLARMTGITSFAGKLIGMVWISITISIILAMLILWLTEYTDFFESVIALFVGVGFFVEAFASRREFAIAAILCWIGAIIVGLFPDLANLTFTILIFATMIVPGIVVKIGSGERKI
jgi:hypothetical protein